MEKYFHTLDVAVARMTHKIDSEKAKSLFRRLLDTEHQAGPEADYIIRTWKQERGYE